MSLRFLRIGLTYFVLITIAIAASTYFLTSSYALSLSIDALISHYIKETAGIILITEPLDEEAFQRLKEIEGVESVHRVLNVHCSMPWEVVKAVAEIMDKPLPPLPPNLKPGLVGTIVGLNLTDFPLMALPHLVRGRYPEKVGECIINEILFRALERLYGFKLTDVIKVNASIISHSEAGTVYEYVMKVYEDFKKLSNMVLMSTAIISVIGISAARAFEMLRGSWHYGLSITTGWSWRCISSYEFLRSLLSSTLSIIIGLILALSYGPLLAQFIVRRPFLFELGAFDVERILGAALLALPVAIIPLIIGIILMIKWRRKTIADLLRSRG